MRLQAFGAIIVLAASCSCLAADEWPQFRGANGAATSADDQLPLKWNAETNVSWKVKLPGYGWSSPIVWDDKVFVTTAVTDKQQKPSGGFGPGGFGPGRGGPGGFGGGRPQPGQLLPGFLQQSLGLNADQQKQLDELQKEVDAKVGKILTDEQRKQRQTTRGGPGMAPPGQVLSAAQRNRLKLSDAQAKQIDGLQKEVDDRLARILTDEQHKQMQNMRQTGGRGRGGFGGPGGFGGAQRPPDAIFRLQLYCLDRATGTILWQQTAYEGKPRIPTQGSNTYASETPVTDGQRVYAYFGMHGVYCFDFSGKLVWKADLGSYPMAMGHGTGSSPALAEGRLFIQCDNEDHSFLAALDTKTGRTLWRVPRVERTNYSTPLVWRNKLRTEVVCLGSPTVRSYDPATGKQLWELGGMTGQPKASAVASADFLYVGTGGGPGGFGGPPGGGRGGFGGPPDGPGDDFGPPDGGPGGFPGGPEDDSGPRGGSGRGPGGSRPFYAVKAGAAGDITLRAGAKSNAGVAWELPKAGPQTASPLLYQGYLYVVEEHSGLLSCYDAGTGKQIYKERLPGARGFTASPWAAGNKVFFLDDSGTTFIVQAGREFKVLGKNALGEMSWSSPAMAGGVLLLRTVDHLYAIKRTE